MPDPLYDDIGRTYVATRQTDPRIAEAIWHGLGGARSVLNVGAGAGSYEPAHLDVTAVEPSEVMMGQRPLSAAPAIQASAESLPFPDDSFDAVLAVLSDHHWTDRRTGFAELGRVARDRVVIFNADPAEFGLFWMNTDYLPDMYLVPENYRRAGFWRRELERFLGPISLTPVPIPHDCIDGFYGAYWRRPEAFLDPQVRAGISVFAKMPADVIASGLGRLERDLADGTWDRRHGDLREAEALHLGYYAIVARLPGRS